MNARTLPNGPWEVLFPRALKLIQEIETHSGISDPFWTFGGGTVLMFRYRHRISKDIDIFVPDPQYLGFVTPKLSDTAAELTEDYIEMPNSFVKLQFEEGEVDFVAAPNLTKNAWEPWEIFGRTMKVETAAEIIAKKMFHRGDRVTARDLFDLSLVIEKEPGQLQLARQFLLRHRDSFVAQIKAPHPTLRIGFDAIATLEYRPSFEHCVEQADAFLSSL